MASPAARARAEEHIANHPPDKHSASSAVPKSSTASTKKTTTTTQRPHKPTSTAHHDAFRPQLNERDSIFATSYAGSPVNARSSPSPPHLQRSSLAADQGIYYNEGGRSGKSASMATATATVPATPLLNNGSDSIDFARGHQKKDATSTRLYHSRAADIRRRPNSNTLAPHYQRRSLYDIHDLNSLPTTHPPSSTTHSRSRQDSPFRADTFPAAPDSMPSSPDTADSQSAERQQYRSWRQGEAKMQGLTIAQSQRKASTVVRDDVDKVIDAQLPQPEPVAAVRSRKASHYLGLFRENEQEEKRETERKKAGRGKDGSKSQISRDLEEQADASSRGQTISETIEEEDGDYVTVSKKDMAQMLPLGLLEEIRNHHHLVPGQSQKIPFPKDSQLHDHDRRSHEQFRKAANKTEEDDESDREHISSATYYPHQGVQLGDSPGDKESMDRTPKVRPVDAKDDHAEPSANDVQLSLQGEGAPEFLQGMSRAASSADFKDLPQPVPDPEPLTYDSEYESESGYSTVSGDDEDDLATTPTGTPHVKTHGHRRTSRGRRAEHVQAPVGAVELKPYKHQVGGHTSIYRFSRRAVCKQLNSKENKFYETVEKCHRELLGFMPRYIGVLNVTYRKEPRKRKQTVSDGNGANQASSSDSKAQDGNDVTADTFRDPEHTRMISHSMQSKSSSGIPQVLLANNRHLIPESLFRSSDRSLPDLHRTRSTPPTPSDTDGKPQRPALKPAQSWGFTSVNEHLRDKVLREVFTPPVIHKSHRRDRGHGRSLRPVPPYIQNELSERNKSVDVSSLQHKDSKDLRKECLKGPFLRRAQLSVENRSTSDLSHVLLKNKDTLSKSAENSGLNAVPAESGERKARRRRHSGGGLMRKPTDIEGTRGHLECYEDAEEDVFAMDDVKKDSPTKDESPITGEADPDAYRANGTASREEDQPVPQLGPAIDFGVPEPRNPVSSLVEQDERVEHFILLEDLTAGMQKPCVLDLKMGTRQYGIEAAEKKQRSQRAKCKSTTSRELGVRVCGMQVYNVKQQGYDFQDKYFGRDLKAGEEFREALKRFFFDGIGYAQALKHIPCVLDKIDALEEIIRKLPGYRLYASSLLMIYDRGDADMNGKLRESDASENGNDAPVPGIKLKIVDFANCVTAESLPYIQHKPCPPRNPNQIDRGYLRGLRTLRLYFQRIYTDLHNQKYVERGEGEGMAMDQRGIGHGIAQNKGWTERVMEDDPGEVSV
ncbi:Kinase [Cercospora zeina]